MSAPTLSATFHPHGSSWWGMPDYLVATVDGAWSVDTVDDCVELARRLADEGVRFRLLRAHGEWSPSALSYLLNTSDRFVAWGDDD